MKGSLQDQLLGVGLIKKQEAKNIKTAKKKAVKQSRVNNAELTNEAAELAEKARLEEQRKSQELNAKRKRQTEQKAVQAQIRQIIEINSIKPANEKAPDDSELTYNFTDNKKIKTIQVSPENHNLISRGIIAIAKLVTGDNDSYHLIPAEAARKINQRDSTSIVLLNAFSERESIDKDNADDPYASYQIPDDLMW